MSVHCVFTAACVGSHKTLCYVNRELRKRENRKSFLSFSSKTAQKNTHPVYLSGDIEGSSSCNVLYLLISFVYHPITKGKNTCYLLRLCLNFSSSATNDSHSEQEHAVHPLNKTPNQPIWHMKSSGMLRSRSKSSFPEGRSC